MLQIELLLGKWTMFVRKIPKKWLEKKWDGKVWVQMIRK